MFWCLRVGSGCGSLGKVNLVVSRFCVLCLVFGEGSPRIGGIWSQQEFSRF